MTIAHCPHRDGANAPPRVVRLWDGRDHCRDCVEAACPGLSRFARGREWLEDSIPHDPEAGIQVWWKYVALSFGVLALVAPGVLAVLDLREALTLVGLMAGCLAFGMLVNLTSVFKARRVLPTVRVREGIVEVSRPLARKPMATYPLLEARWHLGRLNEDSFARGRGGAIVPDRPAVILRAPRRWKLVAPPSEVTATGSTPEMIRLWRGFLEVAGVPEGR
jgi:hypothetical protein